MIDYLYIEYVTQCCPDNMKNQVLGVITDLSENPKVCVCAHACACVILCCVLCIFVCHVQDMVNETMHLGYQVIDCSIIVH